MQIKHSNDHIKGHQVRKGGGSTLVPPFGGNTAVIQLNLRMTACEVQAVDQNNPILSPIIPHIILGTENYLKLSRQIRPRSTQILSDSYVVTV